MVFESIWTWIFILGAAAIGSVGYYVVKRIEAAETRRLLLPEPEEEARARYKAAWRRYRRLRLEFPLLIPGWFVFSGMINAIFQLFGWNQNIAWVFILAYIPYMSFVGCQWIFWQCPRCGKAFKGSTYFFFPKHCSHCDLPMWAVSPEE
ncbi:MAG TPA: hypothetical protein VN830_02200 [Verrucomicrobiae bacterium]|nr:hypothetical protein [Verrucomicrobiae bacterium]